MDKEIFKSRTPVGAQSRMESNASSRAETNALSRYARLCLATALGASLLFCRNDAPQARQRLREPEVRVTGIATGGRTVSITADGSLNRAQTWQDEEGFHVVLPNGQSDLAGSARGVKVRRIGNSLELVVPVSRGASVTVQPRGNRLDLVINGGGDNAAESALSSRQQATTAADSQESAGAAASSRTQELLRSAEARARRARESTQASVKAQGGEQSKREVAAGEMKTQTSVAPKSKITEGSIPEVNQGVAGLPQTPEAATQVAAAVRTDLVATSDGAQADSVSSIASIIFSLPALLVAFGLALGGLLLVVMRRRRAADGKAGGISPAGRSESARLAAVERGEESAAGVKASERDALNDGQLPEPFIQNRGDRRRADVTVPFDRRRTGQGAEDEALRNAKSLAHGGDAGEGRRSGATSSALPTVVFGAYRVDQEVVRLVQGKTHSVEVIASRASDDRRAVETSLLKVLRSPEIDEDGRRRARTALEDYGFVARSCASLLLGSESFDRASAAAALGEMRSPQALPFLTEALYDPDTVVRAETVKSLGALGLPSAIGALLDTARRHPDLSTEILQPALTACSVESLGLLWGQAGDAQGFAEMTETDSYAGDDYGIEPVSSYETLPEWVEDATLREALEYITDEDSDVRVHCAQQLAQFQVRRAVEALGSLAVHDADAAVRAAAVSSLGLVNHESVFAPVLLAMADEAREVRAAAARALSRLSFDRAEAYARVARSADAETVQAVASACVASGLAAQAFNRLASEDPRQAHEAATLLTLVLKSGDARPVIEAIEGHREVDVRIACVRLLGMMNRQELIEELRSAAEGGGLHPRVRLALSELSTVRQEQPQMV